jgi:superoxide dismutase, Cu-Zn family
MRTSLLFSLVCACAASQSGPRATNAAADAISSATAPAGSAKIDPRSGSALSGSAKFVDVDKGLGVHVEVENAAPGLHGVHIHEKGDCNDPKAMSAGGHYNPNAGPHHGGPATPVRHGGDLGNMEVQANGKGALDVVVQDLTVAGLENGVVGRAIVVHEKADDLQTDPAGNSGARIGCGVILPPTAQPSR